MEATMKASEAGIWVEVEGGGTMTYEQALRNYHNVLDGIRNQAEGTTILTPAESARIDRALEQLIKAGKEGE